MKFDTGEIRISVGDGKVMKVPTENVQVCLLIIRIVLVIFLFKINPSTGVINFSEEVGKTFIWKSIAKQKNRESEKKSSSTDKPSRRSGIKNKFVIESKIYKKN
jgi:hypothetical protein